MGYRLPKRRLSTRDCPDPKLFSEAIKGVAEELAGNVNEHNVEADSLNAVRVPAAMQYDFHYVSVDADSGINPDDFPNDLDSDAVRVSDGGDWQAVQDMSLTYSAAEHVVWAIGWLYYGLVDTSFSTTSTPANKPRVQFALEINGTIIGETITGTERPDEGAPRTLRPIVQVDAVGPKFRTLDYESSPSTGALSWHVRPVRFQCNIQVPEGETTVRIMARRVMASQPSLNESMPPVYIYNRKLLAVEMKLGDTSNVIVQTVAINYPEDGDPLNVANTYTSQVAAVVTAENALTTDAIQRFGLRKEHLPVFQLWDTAIDSQISGNLTTKTYPGFANTGSAGASPNWKIVDDSGGNNLQVKLDDGSGFWDFTENPAFVIVLGNLGFTGASGSGDTPERYGAFGLGMLYQGGGTTLGDGSDYADQALINNPNIKPLATPVSMECHTDVPMLGVYDFRSAPPAGGPVDYIRFLASCWNTSTVTWERGSLIMLIFRP